MTTGYSIMVLLVMCVGSYCSEHQTDFSASTDLLWPIPNNYSVGEDMLSIDPGTFSFVPDGKGGATEILRSALSRYMNLIFLPPPVVLRNSEAKSELSHLYVTVDSDDVSLGLDTSDNYSLDTSTGKLVAGTVYGALRGLETFSQLISATGDGKYQIPSFKTDDSATFRHRGFMIDTARHYLDLQTIYRHIDAMAWNKFNVLHWHIVDDQSFPYTSITFPDMATMGAYDKNHLYSQDDIAMVIKYAKDRGIRVVVEFDTPGHTQSWGKGRPNLLTPCYADDKPSGKFGPINPIVDSTWDFLEKFFTEISKVFPDDYIHVGGDEVSFHCWASNPDIKKWMETHKYTNYSHLEQYYETRLLKLIGSIGKQYIVWQEIFDNGLQVLPDTVVNIWKGNWQSEAYNVTKAGLKTIISSCWYLNYISYGSDWRNYYKCDPLAFNGSQAQQDLVVGGEACVWAEYVDATNFLSRSWPRACPVAERLWSKTDFSDVQGAEVRLHSQRCRMIARGIPAEPATGPSYCPTEWKG